MPHKPLFPTVIPMRTPAPHVQAVLARAAQAKLPDRPSPPSQLPQARAQAQPQKDLPQLPQVFRIPAPAQAKLPHVPAKVSSHLPKSPIAHANRAAAPRPALHQPLKPTVILPRAAPGQRPGTRMALRNRDGIWAYTGTIYLPVYVTQEVRGQGYRVAPEGTSPSEAKLADYEDLFPEDSVPMRSRLGRERPPSRGPMESKLPETGAAGLAPSSAAAADEKRGRWEGAGLTAPDRPERIGRFVFRGDSRAPEEIFSSGFSTRREPRIVYRQSTHDIDLEHAVAMSLNPRVAAIFPLPQSDSDSERYAARLYRDYVPIQVSAQLRVSPRDLKAGARYTTAAGLVLEYLGQTENESKTPQYRFIARELPPLRYDRETWVYFVYLETGFNTSARQALAAGQGAPKAVANLFACELAATNIPAKHVVGAIRCTREFKPPELPSSPIQTGTLDYERWQFEKYTSGRLRFDTSTFRWNRRYRGPVQRAGLERTFTAIFDSSWHPLVQTESGWRRNVPTSAPPPPPVRGSVAMTEFKAPSWSFRPEQHTNNAPAEVKAEVEAGRLASGQRVTINSEPYWVEAQSNRGRVLVWRVLRGG